ncbi:response regulator [Lyngbya aestuarii]|uniref:response regulator n=1 Tax=Lyngbya aestuarii TaxID=118322 RepID=UPI00403E1108
MKSQETIRPKLLVVDDEPDNLDLLYRTFYRDYKVLRAENGHAALEILAKEGDVAVIISDQRMPLMSGTEFLSITAAQYPDIIRIILTGYTDVEDLVDAINDGKVFKFVRKPWRDEELKAVVRQAMDTHNVLKIRTSQLCQALRREMLLNSVTNTIRNAQYKGSDSSPLRRILQTIVEAVGHVLEVDFCILRPFQDEQLEDEWFVYQNKEESLPSSPSYTGAALAANSITKRNSFVEYSVTESDALEGECHFSHVTPLSCSYPISSSPKCLLPSGKTSTVDTAKLKSPTTPYPQCLIKTLWKIGEVVVINDVATDEHFKGDTTEIRQRTLAYQQANISSTLMVPLISQQELMAVLALHRCGKPHVWGDDEIQLVAMVADQAALALSQARAYERVRALAKRQELVNTITTAIRSTLEPQKIFMAITQQLGQALQVDGCTLSLWTEEDEYVQCVGFYDRKSAKVWGNSVVSDAESASQKLNHDPFSELNPDKLPRSIVPIDCNPILKKLVDTQEPVAFYDLDSQPEISGFDLPVRVPARAILVVPLLADGKIIGSITLRQLDQPRHWNRSDIELAQAVASQAAIAVGQSQLYQKTRRLAERLLELDRQKTEFFQNISHEFRTPLTLIIGPLESAIRQQQCLPYDQGLIALRNSRRLLRLVNQLLDFQRLDAGRMQASFHVCDLVEVVSQIVEAFRPYCEKKNIGISTHFTPCPPVYLDLEKFDKILYNLLSNAVKFSGNQGSISVRVEPIADQVRMKITDTGIGIHHEQIPYLFERFQQASGSVNRTHEGSGLGLALAKELVELHGGQISVESVYSQYTAFTVLLPIGNSHLPPEQVMQVSAAIESSRAAVELADLGIVSPLLGEEVSSQNQEDKVTQKLEDTLQDSLSGSGSILVVEDNSDLRAYLSRIFQQAGYQVWTARNGEEGFCLTKEHHPQLIVTDLMMPVVSGLDLISMIRASEQLKGTPIILLTAQVSEKNRIEGTEEGADAYISKPFQDRELLAEVRNLLALKANEQRVINLNTYLTESVLKRFLPPAMVKAAARGELVLDLHPEPRPITVLFSDIVGFTQLANTLRARRVAELLNEYLEAMTNAVFDNGGTIDKFMGDGILAIFGAPEEISPTEQVRLAVASARQMHSALHQLNQRWQERGILGKDGLAAVQFRCGIHQGAAVVGMFGSSKRSDYTAIGPCVNIAARLQEAAQPNSILVSAAVADLLEDDGISKGHPLKLKGIDETVLTFSVRPESN